MNINVCPCAFAIQVQVADVEIMPCLFEPLPLLTINSPRQSELGVVRDIESRVEIFSLEGCQHGAENLFLRDARHWINIADDRWLDEPPALGFSEWPAACKQLAFA